MKRKHFEFVIFSFIIGMTLGMSLCGGSQLFAQDKAYVSFRIGTSLWRDEACYNELLSLFEKYRGVTDEITFFTNETHAPLPLQEMENRIDTLQKRVAKAKSLGYKSGINILTTIGHHEENLDHSLKGNYTHLTDIDGKVCLGSYCPNDPDYQKYIRAVYTHLAKASPDYIWIDDDVRLNGHMPIFSTCYCDRCLQIFEKEYGMHFTRETLKKRLDEGSIAEKQLWRRRWIQHNRNTLASVFKLIENTVHTINPTLSIGFMTGDRMIEGYDFDYWAQILAGKNHVPVKWRPGGGFYNDDPISGLVEKSHDIGRQVSALPTEVKDIQSEIENFPYQRLKKATSVVVLEAASHIASGCTGAAFNVLPMFDESLDEYEPLIKQLKERRPFFDLLVSHLGRLPLQGVQTFWNKDIYVTNHVSEGSFFSGTGLMAKHELYDIGIPASYTNDPANSSVILLTKENVYAMSKDELRSVLSHGVYMDCEALQQLNDLGYSDLTGFKVIASDAKDRIECYTSHPLNGKYAGQHRDCRQSFWSSQAYSLQPLSGKAVSLSSLVDYSGTQRAACTMGIYENRLGGRICVSGYFPWSFLENGAKSTQMKAVMLWLSKDSLPAYVASFHKINVWVRKTQDGVRALTLTNSSFDEAQNVVLCLKTAASYIEVLDMDCKIMKIPASSTLSSDYRTFIIPAIAPWQMRLVVCK